MIFRSIHSRGILSDFVVDQHRLYANPDPDPTFHFDDDPNPDPTPSFKHV